MMSWGDDRLTRYQETFAVDSEIASGCFRFFMIAMLGNDPSFWPSVRAVHVFLVIPAPLSDSTGLSKLAQPPRGDWIPVAILNVDFGEQTVSAGRFRPSNRFSHLMIGLTKDQRPKTKDQTKGA
jgi:hypothetical protein